jgi:hypothetical protein
MSFAGVVLMPVEDHMDNGENRYKILLTIHVAASWPVALCTYVLFLSYPHRSQHIQRSARKPEQRGFASTQKWLVGN